MSVNFTVTGTKFLKVTVTKDNDVRFKVPEHEKQYYDLDTLIGIANDILDVPLIVEYELTLRGKLTDNGTIPLYNETGSKKNRKRNHIYTVFL